MQPSLKSVMHNAVVAWRSDATKEQIAEFIARNYHKMKIFEEEDCQPEPILKVPSAHNNPNNTQNLFRYVSRTSIEAKANIMDLLPAVIAAMPKARATAALNQFLNPLGFSVAAIGACNKNANRDQLLADFSKESSEAFRSVLLLSEHATHDQLRDAYRELQESAGSHEPLLHYIETLMAQKG
ncbi:hypothetical protein F0267_22220 [Vibrio coralliilyticus]|uniref:Bacterial toxin YdaT domain-containing protein n=1 Tax=Vibrio coralliilyticus TaxID=190893 RepID=A0AAN0VZ77_9VIBR|nr:MULTISPECIES: toxin YdaT family protein [Vibrio]AIW21335.1 hypothetical protein IX92_20180 [Vibrio coralliilyticus]MDA0118513.1 toxin YdaT family protein [Vibrio sp. T11.5]NOH40944.1 hypothetical protein [Vibrio coralliilyticus]NOI20845.1 hypothetical protein [Vibrio coralliilyticus]